MSPTFVPRVATTAVALTLAVAVVVSTAPGFAAEGADSPQAVVAGMKAAAEAGDFGAMAALVVPSARAEMTVSLLAGVTMMVAFAQMGGGMAGEMSDAFADEEMTAEQKAEMEAQQAAAQAEAAALQERLAEVLTRHGLEEFLGDEMATEEDAEERSPEEMLAGVDQPQLINDLMDIMNSLGADQGMSGGPGPMGELTGLQVDGDRASGMVGEEPATFVRIDGRWYAEPPQQ